MKRSLSLLCLFILSSHLQVWAQNKPSDTPTYRLYLIGDAGSPGGNPSLDMLKQKLNGAKDSTGVIFLGDNIYQRGMPVKGSKNRSEAEEIIDSQINTVKDFKGNVFFIPGNHDWDNGKNGGWKRLKEQEAYIENRLD